MDMVRMGVVGLGVMGSGHAQRIGKIKGAKLAAVADVDAQRATALASELGCTAYESPSALIRSGQVDAVMVATPHFSHTPIAIEALEAGLHVLVEKPVGVHKADVERMIAAHTNKSLKFAAMFNQRTDPSYRKLKQLITGGELGEIRRVSWIITAWFRSQAYYRSGGWRATWAGEGGGVMLNQCPHQLDLFQWLFGMPCRVHGFCHFGKFHDIEVEDEVTAYMDFPNGASGVFITSTGEAPGTNRLEVAAERGRLTVEDGTVRFLRNEQPMSEYGRETTNMFGKPATWDVTIPIRGGSGGQHDEITQNFVDAILKDVPLIARAEEGINSVELANAILFSQLTKETIDLPLDSAAFKARLDQLIAGSRYREKPVATDVKVDLAASFA